RGFEWIDLSDWESSVISFLRKDKNSENYIIVVCNFTPVPRYNYKVGSPFGGNWQEVLNSDAVDYGGSGCGNSGVAVAEAVPCHGRPYSFSLTLPPLGILFLKKS
ncbi:MAG: 1,4-alpha-glucan branching enzyme, partial [Candidatus Omnitrophica bacterium]|nr:1,4-alpha-glucan branching enzyme [Candidatus Omnitrophota bacterium]MBD3269367.1 1,4-alpha-glucan branching enzyme [Candidatus Omnitrophota bacterium]